ncbi:hypothetical protein EVAR_75369_1 [Eumeta japonica]|uniref:Uncharacterized protein n=1 Tax=Eumeta variegata TaxID=151549 RepID=A0A4C1YCH0_EUMVA|nr:hypothetical protein EVAR_75369_1 [Eumeta japonica]
MEVDTNPNRPTKRPFESRLSEKLSPDSWSDDSNDLNDSDEAGFTQVQKRKSRQPRLFATYGPGFIRLSGKKPKASTSASPGTVPATLATPAATATGNSTSNHAFLAYRKSVRHSPRTLLESSQPTKAVNSKAPTAAMVAI